MKEHFVITVGREYGSGGREIAKLVAQKLNVPFYDKELLTLAAQKSGICQEIFEHNDEKTTVSDMLPVTAGTGFGAGVGLGLQMPMNQRVFLAQFEVITNLAKEQSCVIVGRCADYVLRERKDLLSVFIHAPLSFRAQRAQKVYEKTASNIEDFVKKKDKKRAAFYNYFSQNKWGDARHYHLAISSMYGVDFAVEVLKHAAESFPGGEAL